MPALFLKYFDYSSSNFIKDKDLPTDDLVSAVDYTTSIVIKIQMPMTRHEKHKYLLSFPSHECS